jgi:hypothetical protein
MLFYRTSVLGLVVGLMISVYSFIAMKRVYGQGYAMTLLKWTALSFSYFTLVAIGMVFALIWAFAAVSPT